MAVGWAALILGMVLMVLMPRALYVYLPFLLAAFLQAVRLLFGHCFVHGVLLLLCVCVSAPALGRQGAQNKPLRLPDPSTAANARRQALQSFAALSAKPIAPSGLSGALPQTTQTNRAVQDSAATHEGVPDASRTFGNLGFESGLDGWRFSGEKVSAAAVASPVSEGLRSLKLEGRWDGWGWNNLHQSVWCDAGDTIEVSGKIFIRRLETTGSWLLAGFKLESWDGNDAMERTVDLHGGGGVWIDISFRTAIRRAGMHVLRCLVCGGESGASAVEVYFDDIRVKRTS